MAYTGSVPDTAAHRLDWMEHAACTNEEDVFDDPTRDHEARTICVARCPVRAFCLAFTKQTEHGLHRHKRGGVAAGLTHEERYRLDTAARHSRGDPELIVFDGSERCGTRQALLRHLWLDEPIDGKCWSGEVHRGHGGRAPRRSAAADTP